MDPAIDHSASTLGTVAAWFSTNFDDVEFRYQLAKESGLEPQWRVPGFQDPTEDARQSIQRIKDSAWLPHRDSARGFRVRRRHSRAHRGAGGFVALQFDGIPSADSARPPV